MKNITGLRLLFTVLIYLLILTACGSETPSTDKPNQTKIPLESDLASDLPITSIQTTSEPTNAPLNTPTPPPNYQLIKPNEVGHIMVVMYHGIEDNPPYHRTVEDFQKDLIYMYNHGYRLLSMRDYIDSNISVEQGFTPIVLTFDDGLSSTFTLETINGELVPKKGTAIGILEEFIEQHPDFGRGGALYLNGEASANFANTTQNVTFDQAIHWLVDHGYDIGNHSYSHPKFNQLNKEELQKELGQINLMIDQIIPGYQMDSLSYPFGIRPDTEMLTEIENGKYQDYEYHYEVALKEGVSMSMVAPINIKFSPYNCPRVRGSEGEESDLWWWFQYYEDYPEYRYISDGDPSTIVVLEVQKELVNQEKLGDKKLIAY